MYSLVHTSLCLFYLHSLVCRAKEVKFREACFFLCERGAVFLGKDGSPTIKPTNAEEQPRRAFIDNAILTIDAHAAASRGA